MFNRRKKMAAMVFVFVLILIVIAIAGVLMPESAYSHNYSEKRLPPSMSHLFGTDYLGRDIFCRTIKGLSISISIGVPASIFGAIIALLLGMSCLLGGKIDKLVLGIVDVFMSLPHLVLMMLISIAVGKGLTGVSVALILTHWPNLTRVVRGEVLEIRSSQYVKAAVKFGVGKLKIAIRHIFPHVLPQFIVGLVLLFPHAVLHEASITFLGFGLPLDTPAIGSILSESMNFLAAGMWWSVVFPGAALLIIVLMFEALGSNLKALLDSNLVQE